MSIRINTPCIGVCSTGIGDSVCRGCKRFAHEVIDWNSYTREQQQVVTDRLDYLLIKVAGNMIEIVDDSKLQDQLQLHRIRYDTGRSAAFRVYELLRAGAEQISQPEAFGFRLKTGWQRFTLKEIRQFLEQDFYTLSCAYYERYIGIVERPGTAVPP